MYCNSCGKPIPDGSKFCPECGASFVSAAQPQQAVPQYQVPPQAYQPAAPAAPKASLGSSPKRLGGLILLITAALSVIALFFDFYRGYSYWGYRYFTGFDAIDKGSDVGTMLICCLPIAVAIIVFSILCLCDTKMNAKALKIVLMCLVLTYAACATVTILLILFSHTAYFGAWLHVLMAVGTVFIFFFVLKKGLVTPAQPQVAPQQYMQ